MTRKSSFLPTTPPAVLIASVTLTKQLLITLKSTAAGAVDQSGSSLESLSKRSTQITDILRKFEGYSHHGINE